MTAPSSCSPCPVPTRAEVELSLKSCNQATLEAMLRVIQLRLGTPGERLGDMDYAQLVAHQLNNIFTAQRLAQALRRLDDLPP